MQKLFNKLSIAGIILLLLLVLLLIDVFISMNNILEIQDRAFINLNKGATIKSLANDLHQKGYLKQKDYLRIWARLQGVSTKLKAGEYTVQPGDSLTDLLNKMVSGKVEQYKLTLIEGWTFNESLMELYRNPHVNHTLSGHTNEQLMERLGYKDEHPEGRFYPDTYFINKNTSDSEILKRAYLTMQQILEDAWRKRDADLPFKNAYEALILASIVEKESAAPEERTKIAGVFINRLNKNMRLQTDPTVIYGMGNAYKGDIRFRDLRQDTPYNTYTRKGLPPTPIAMPGREAIKAVMHPEKTDALYFVAYGDGSGRHFFSSNLEDHNNAVDLYQRKR